MSNEKRDTARALLIAERGDQRGKWTRKPKTHCVNGHAFTDDNVYYDPKDGTRACNACRAQKNQIKKLLEYGITEDEETLLWQRQCGLCAICQEPLHHGSGTAGAKIDHDHTTGSIRGILCGNCNIGISHFRDDPKRCSNAAAYLNEIRKER